ncbi:FecR family protein [Pedobacter sp. HDW13]|uniref:FecR family protein n=1 Tax=unclassified Pedobacter TaxID=2628915 RepID=UPI000F592005|nr:MULTISPECIES: FecR family protein [unclassified Pedobacter]QIL40049.1 FecR family protein [Pedobacter sp. HDW13]RQO68293.1 anti-sigma factor [Pedobacter sp. KBW01]
MVDRSKFNAEDFLVDSTFQQYCAGTDALCIGYWEKYINAHPEQALVIAEAKKLYVILSGNKRPLNKQRENLAETMFPVIETVKLKSYGWLKIAAAIVLVLSSALLYRLYFNKGNQNAVQQLYSFTTKSGERKKIMLQDGTSVLLNAKSNLTITKGFNDKCREVTLTGEAFFDVAHDKNRPFKVHTSDFNINVLGTAFNVKAYPDEITSEATLIRGLITMEAVSGNGGTITLKPSQKVTFYKIVAPKQHNKLVKPTTPKPEITINHYTKIKDSTIVETAWTQNRIEIYDQDFDEIKNVLEKWYNVEISFKDPEIEKYRFTATITNESIEEVLHALKATENNFKYEIKGKQITISK